MATSAIGPGFLTQTTVFTEQLGASLGFAIIISILFGLGAQLNIWRVVAVTEQRAQDVANRLLPGLGHLLIGLIALGELAFNDIDSRLFGLVMWAAAITSVVGAAYTSVSFLRSVGGAFDRRWRELIILFITVSALVFAVAGRPVKTLILVGAPQRPDPPRVARCHAGGRQPPRHRGGIPSPPLVDGRRHDRRRGNAVMGVWTLVTQLRSLGA